MRLSCAGVTSVAGAAAACLEIYAGTGAAYPARFKLLELGLFQNTAATSQVALGRAAVIGGTPAGAIAFGYHDNVSSLPASSILAYTTWAVGPTVPTAFFRQISLPATIGAGVIWTFSDPIIIVAGGSLVVWNIAASSPLDFYATVEV